MMTNVRGRDEEVLVAARRMPRNNKNPGGQP
jgi:hypothetical protein